MPLFGDINEIKLMGNLTQDPELRYTANGSAVCSFSMATNRRYKQGEEYKDEVTYHNIVVWGNLAQAFSQRAKKGTRVMIVGRIQNRSWDGSDGQKKYRTEIVADDAYLIDRYEKGKMEGGAPARTGSYDPAIAPEDSNFAPDSAGYASGSSENSARMNASKAQTNDDIVDPDDLPF